MKLPIMTLLWLLVTVSHAISGDDLTTKENLLNSNRTSDEQLSFMLDELSETPHDGKICNSIGFYFYKLRKYEAAIKYYRDAITLTPEYPISYNNLGVVYLKQNQLHLAEEYFRRAIELDPKYVKAICNLSVVCFKLERKAEALELYNQAKIINPGYIKERIARFREMKQTSSY
jgi:tetratricopeptide (TPR) repeat protein